MPPNKGGNAKKEAGRAKKADNEVSPSRLLALSSRVVHQARCASWLTFKAKKQEEVIKGKEAKEAKDWESGGASDVHL